jgi:hypothetical protein
VLSLPEFIGANGARSSAQAQRSAKHSDDVSAADRKLDDKRKVEPLGADRNKPQERCAQSPVAWVACFGLRTVRCCARCSQR